MTRNGFTQPSSKHQVASRVLLVAFGSVYFSLFAVNVESGEYLALLVGYSVLVGLVVVAGTAVTAIDPTDPVVKHTRSPHYPLSGEVKLSAAYCVLCKSRVQYRTRHCRKCQRCVSKFDHHCVWLNNCIGKANYAWFLLLISALECVLVVQVYAGAVTLRQVFVSPSRHLLAKYDFGECGYFFFAVLLVMTAMSIVVAMSNSVLLVFHMYLCVRRITTIEYMMLMKTKVAPVTVDISKHGTSQVVPEVADSTCEKSTNDSKEAIVCTTQKERPSGAMPTIE